MAAVEIFADLDREAFTKARDTADAPPRIRTAANAVANLENRRRRSRAVG